MQNRPVRRSCFICGSIAGDEIAAHEMSVCGLGRVSYALRCCDGCGLVLQDPAIPPATMALQYAMFSNYTAFDAGDPALSPSAGRMLQAAASAGLRPGEVYDVGAATGAMLWHFRRHGWSVGGCDPSPTTVSQAKARNDIDLDLGACEQTLPTRRGLDLITMSHVLEHIYNPVSALGAVHAALADGGCLLLEVPCLTAPGRNPPGLFTLEHVNFFEQTSISNLLRIAGFEVMQATVTLDNFPFPVITVLASKAAPQARAELVNAFAETIAFGRAYRDIERNRWAGVDARLCAAVGVAEPIYVWGAGVHTSMLLERTSLGQRGLIVAITDRDTQKHGHRLADHPVVKPAAALEGGRKIVISSYVSEAAIAGALLGQGVPPDHVVRLYS